MVQAEEVVDSDGGCARCDYQMGLELGTLGICRPSKGAFRVASHRPDSFVRLALAI